MQPSTVVALLLVFMGLAFCQNPTPPTQPDLYPQWDAGIETIWLNDISFANEISFQTWGQNNWSAYIYGDRRVRTVYLARDWFVGATPNENWHLPFIDIHTFQNGSDVWGIGPINALYARNRTVYSGFQFEIAVVSTKLIPDNPRGRIFVEQPLGFEGTFYTVRLAGFNMSTLHGYFCGFFPSNLTANPWNLSFGVRRGWFNNSLFDGNQSWNVSNDAWSFNRATDDAVIFPNAQLVTYSADFKPILLHAWNITGSPPNTTYLVMIDPFTNFINLITGNFDPTVPLNVTQWSFVPTFGGHQFGRIVSAVVWQDLVFVGVSVDGQGTGWIDVLNVANLTRRANSIVLPTNYSDPRALVLDFFDDQTPTLYVGPNGGWALLKIDINTLTIVGYQNLPFYLHRTWRGMTTPEHVYFITNEQNSKVYRVGKEDFCPTPCMEFGYCHHGRCVCNENFVQKGNKCEWKTIEVETHIAHKDKGGEVALGIFFAIATIAAGAGWYMVWKSRRGYQAVN